MVFLSLKAAFARDHDYAVTDGQVTGVCSFFNKCLKKLAALRELCGSHFTMFPSLHAIRWSARRFREITSILKNAEGLIDMAHKDSEVKAALPCLLQPKFWARLFVLYTLLDEVSRLTVLLQGEGIHVLHVFQAVEANIVHLEARRDQDDTEIQSDFPGPIRKLRAVQQQRLTGWKVRLFNLVIESVRMRMQLPPDVAVRTKWLDPAAWTVATPRNVADLYQEIFDGDAVAVRNFTRDFKVVQRLVKEKDIKAGRPAAHRHGAEHRQLHHPRCGHVFS